MLLMGHVAIGGFIQYGCRKHHQAAELIQVVRVCFEKATEWGKPALLLSLDLVKAFDKIKFKAILRWFKKQKIPLCLKYALLRELMVRRRISLYYRGTRMKDIYAFCGLRQGAPESSYIFACIIADALSQLSEKWRGEGKGLFLGAFGGESIAFHIWYSEYLEHLRNYDPENLYVSCLAFLDDIYVLAESLHDLQSMLEDIAKVMLELGLELNVSKLKWLANRWADVDEQSHLIFEGNRVYASEGLKILGSWFCANLQERTTVTHRIHSAWACYARWSHILEARVPMKDKVALWALTCLRSLLWGLQTTRALRKKTAQKLLACQKYMFRRMAQVKRKPEQGTGRLEPWVDYHTFGISVLDQLDGEKRKWVQHISRMGLDSKEPHLVKRLLLWRPRSWSIEQEIFNELGWSVVRRPEDLGRPLIFEKQFSSNWLRALP